MKRYFGREDFGAWVYNIRCTWFNGFNSFQCFVLERVLCISASLHRCPRETVIKYLFISVKSLHINA